MKSFVFSLMAYLVSASGAAHAQPIPDEAKLVRLSVSDSGYVLLGEERHRLAASAQIRDVHNRIVLPASLRGSYAARVLVDRNGDLWRAWLLKPASERTWKIEP